jgi:hypothetical protein
MLVCERGGANWLYILHTHTALSLATICMLITGLHHYLQETHNKLTNKLKRENLHYNNQI